MNDDGAEKRFDATPSRRERAKRDGRSARSQEAAGVASFAAALAGFALSAPLLSAAAAVAVRASATTMPAIASATTMPAIGIVQVLAVPALACIPALCAAFGATFATLAQTGGLHLARIALGFDKLAPWAGLKRMFGAEAAVGAARATMAFGVVVAIVVPGAIHAVVAASASESLAATATIARDAALQACVAAAVTGAAFALWDYGLVRRRWLQSLKMTFDEFKRDAKEQDGDPQAKSRRRTLHRSLVRGGIGRTREASFVIVNPTHIAIAIRYAPPAVPVPEIVVRAADALALDVRAIAERAGIPIVADVALARLLWRTGETGHPIPAETFVAVATAIAALIRAGVLAP